MKTFEAKTLEDAKRVACEELGITSEELKYNIIDEKRGLFSKKVVIECYSEKMVEDYIKDYVTTILNDMGFEVEIVTFKQDDRIYCNIDTDNNSILIGKAGVILRTLNFITKNAVATTFKERIEVSLDINGYKENRYKKVLAMAKRFGKQVQRTHIDVALDPLPADERKIMHQAIAEMEHLSTESQGEGRNRFITIHYVD
ncbi:MULTISPECIES: R3H domain-containing nucleic acid-binding protein [Kandleria]|uniref:SpoIIIJ-associated protein n=1 Tax=Kandleria vitulina TaxID=1630 RepID=A0A1H2TEJ8_9FIRM|nr:MULTISPECIES: R3H domain-containing nucleic acid-binding protein [Kandleria]MBO5628017.1 Jag N-terminal domain-containing protein [Aeriscardovia sp.]MBP3276516.1 Jag N-terminal domain-containing protein [Kandleria sp.]SDW41659.1 spoIIIJ-associated protein [Kandleria vitulina]HBG67793.1 protein jag [Kandleria vitulina]HCY53668.1 protein jag [Kandleria vitulina]